MLGLTDVGTPGQPDPDTLTTTLGSVSNTAMASLPNQSLGHQCDVRTGGNEIHERVLSCSNLNLTYNYGKLFETFCQEL